MKLLTKELIEKFPALYSTENKDIKDVKIVAKFFCPWNGWTWYATELNPAKGIFYGYVKGLENEVGYFTLEELQSVRGPGGLGIERDLYFGKEHTLEEAIDGKI